MNAVTWTETKPGRFESSKVGAWHGVARNVGQGKRPWRSEIHSDAKDVYTYGAAFMTSDAAIDSCETMLKTKARS